MATHRVDSSVRRSPLIIQTLAVFTIFVCVNLSFVYCGYFSVMNEKCNIYFNYTHYYQDFKDFYVKHGLKMGEACRNDTIKSVGRKLTWREKLDCSRKCEQYVSGVVTLDGVYDPKLLDRVKKDFQKYSNATASYITKIISMLSECSTQVAEKFNSMQSKENANISACLRSRLSDECGWKVFNIRPINTTKEEICGDLQQG